MPTAAGYALSIDERLDRATDVDLVIVPAHADRTEGSHAVLDLLRSTVERGARVMSVCPRTFARRFRAETGTGAMLRHHFARIVGGPPGAPSAPPRPDSDNNRATIVRR